MIEIKAGELIIFECTQKKVACRHLSAIVSRKMNTLTCKDCNEPLNPIEWISDNMKAFVRNEKVLNEKIAKLERLKRELDAQQSLVL